MMSEEEVKKEETGEALRCFEIKRSVYFSEEEEESSGDDDDDEEKEIVPMVMSQEKDADEDVLSQSLRLCNLSQKQGYDISEFGLEARSWLKFLEGFKSRERYVKSVQDFLIFHLSRGGSPDIKSMDEGLEEYFEELWKLKHAPTSLKSILPIMKKFWLHTGRGDLGVRVPIIMENIKKWMKTHHVKKACVFTKEDLLRYHSFEDDEITLVRKVHSVLAVGVSGRCGELWNLKFEDISRSIDQKTGEGFYRVRNEIFHKLLRSKSGELRASGSKIGRNTLAKFSIDVARRLGLNNPERYTSHAYKRSSLTFMADHGLTLPEVKGASGHRSDAVAQEYIDHSIIQKRKAADALQLVGSDQNVSSTKVSCRSVSASKYDRKEVDFTSDRQIIYDFSGSVFHFGGSMNVSSVPGGARTSACTTSSSTESSVSERKVSKDDSYM